MGRSRKFFIPRFFFLTSQTGATLIELLVVVAIFTVIAGFGFIVSTNFYRKQVLDSERTSILSILRRARSKALNNINESNHGFYIDSDRYVIFEGPSYTARNRDFDEYYPRAGGITFSGPSEFVFSALDGSSNVSGTIMMTSGSKSLTIKINGEGGINF